MKKISTQDLQTLNGGSDTRAAATGLMCGATLFFLLTPGLQPVASATGIGCATGLYVTFS